MLHTGIQWYNLKPRKNEIFWTNIYKFHNRWAKDGSYDKLFENSVIELREAGKLDTAKLHGDGSNTIVKKGAIISDILGTNIKKVKSI